MTKKKLRLILLIDDDYPTNCFNEMMIEDEGVAEEIRSIQSAGEALDYLANRGKYENNGMVYPSPDLIFLDINMPIVDGFVFLYEFEKFNEIVRNKCKVIILSSSDNKRDIDKIVNNNHVIKFITKPLTEVALDEIKLNNI